MGWTSKVFGTVECMSDVWPRVQSAAGVWATWNDKSGCGGHAQFDFKSHFTPRIEMKRLIEEDQQVSAALRCGLLLPDYLCLGYPVSDQDCLLHGFASSAKEWAAVVGSVKQSACPWPLALSP